MIVVGVMGGLGNQMFQYAAAKHLSVLNRAELRIDASDFRNRTPNPEHTFQLGQFNISAPQASRAEIGRYPKSRRGTRPLATLFRKILPAPPGQDGNARLFEETGGSQFKPEVLELKDDVYLRGYFNSYRYFDHIKERIAAEYVPKSPLGPEAAALEGLIRDSDSVSIHFRRGDYVDVPEIRRGVDGIITDDYYRNAVEYMADAVGTPHFFVFSNDAAWAKENFRIPFKVTYVDFNSPQRGHEDLWLMSRCRHNVTAGGSTFSWWAAYLNPNKDKIVLRTRNVNNDPEFNHPDDLFPPGWTAIPS